MIEWFPHERAPLPRTRLRYVDLDSVLNDGKVERESRAPGFVLLYFGGETHVIFMIAGEAVTAACFSEREQGVIPLPRVRRKAFAEREWADVAYFHAPEPQLRAMFSTATVPQIPSAELNLRDARSVFALMRERRYTGVLEFREGQRAHYMVFQDGLPVHGFFAEQRRSDEVADPESLSSRLERLFEPERVERVTTTGYREVQRLPVQAPTALLKVYGDLVADALDAASETVGRQAAMGCFSQALERVRGRSQALTAYRLDERGRIIGESCAGASELTDGVAALLFDALSAAARGGGPDPAHLLRQVTHENRYILEANGFFERLPWPVSH